MWNRARAFLGVAWWKDCAEYEEGIPDDLTCALVSGYLEKRVIGGCTYYRILPNGCFKLDEGELTPELHNFLIYLSGSGFWERKEDE